MGSAKQQKVIEAATRVFLRYGFRRTTMGDIAQAAGISRPALYLLYCNKEGVFQATFEAMAATILAEIREGLREPGEPLEKLRFAFDRWVVRPYVLMHGSPDAADLVQCAQPFAENLLARAMAEFEALLAGILRELPGPAAPGAPDPAQAAHVLAVSAHGLKTSARSAEELRDMLEALLRMTLGSLGL
jgi:AcrR family transcriptional regulator